MGFASNMNLFNCESVFTWAKTAIGGTWYKLIVAALIVIIVGVLISFFLNTRLGLSIRATGDNPDMVRASSINTSAMITIGLCVANAMTGLSGGLLAQYQKSCDINLGTGMVTIALASLIIGESIIGKGGVLKRVIGVVLGSCLYRFIVAIALRVNVPAECLKLVSSLIVAFAIALPYLKKQAAFMKQRRLAKAENQLYMEQIQKQKNGETAYIGLKMNSLTDKRIMSKLVEASCAGVHIDMVIRGICCLIPGVKGQTENIHIISIVGRFLEHSRIYIFGTQERARIYISSADFMTRNTLRRVEVAAPIEDPDIRMQIQEMFVTMLSDNRKARSMNNKGIYKIEPSDNAPLNSQEVFLQQAYDNAAPATDK